MVQIVVFVWLWTVMHIIKAHAQGADLIVLSSSSPFYTGENIHVICSIDEGDSHWLYTLKLNGRPVQSSPSRRFVLRNVTTDMSGEYRCRASEMSSRGRRFKESNVLPIAVSVDKPKAYARVNGDTVIRPMHQEPELSCFVNDSNGDWAYTWKKDGNTVLDDSQTIIAVDTGKYTCKGIKIADYFESSVFSEDSDAVYIQRELPNVAIVSFPDNSGPVYFPGETIVLQCVLDPFVEWTYEWRTTSRYTPPAQREFSISAASAAHSGDYQCKGRLGPYSFTDWALPQAVFVKNFKLKPFLQASDVLIKNGENVALTCSIAKSGAWQIFFFKYNEDFTKYVRIPRNDVHSVTTNVETGGVYFCRAGKGEPLYFTEDSNAVTIERKGSSQVVLLVQPDWLPLFSGEAVTITCKMYADNLPFWLYEWSTPNADHEASGTIFIPSVTSANSGTYKCKANNEQDPYSTSDWSYPVTVAVLSTSPMASLRADAEVVPAGGIVTLVCSVRPASSGWTYYWYRDTPSNLQRSTQAGVLSVSERGRYWCRGGRGTPVFYTLFSEPISIQGTDNATNVPPDLLENVQFGKSASSFSLIIGMACAVALLILLPLIVLCWYKTSRAIQQSRNTVSGPVQIATVDNQQHLYSSLLHCDRNVYESIRGATANYSNENERSDYRNV